MLLFGSIAITIRPKQPANNRIYRKMDYQFSNDRFYQELRRQSRLASDYGELEGLLVLSHFNADDIFTDRQHSEIYPLDGAAVVIVSRGSIALTKNTLHFELQGPASVFLEPGAKIGPWLTEFRDCDMYVIYMTPEFLKDLHLSVNVLISEEMLEISRPYIELSDHEIAQELRYLKIIRSVLSDEFNPTLNRHILSSLVSSLFYQNSVYHFKRIGSTVIERTPNRRSNYVRDFMRLVHQHHSQERSVRYYASRLCVSPKYLSVIIKESTGRTAAAWIDYFVINEAKNLLRFSGMNVQQVAYSMNFSNQSSFGKYFKHLTGMSPTDFQRSN